MPTLEETQIVVDIKHTISVLQEQLAQAALMNIEVKVNVVQVHKSDRAPSNVLWITFSKWTQ